MPSDHLLEQMRRLVPSPNNQTCECAGSRYCVYCLLADALVEIERLHEELRRCIGERETT